MKRAILFLLLLGSTALAQRIQDQPDLGITDISTPSLIRLPVADIQGGGFGTGRDVGIDVLSRAAQSEILSYTHGLTDAQIGHPLVGEQIYNDTVASVPTAVVLDTLGTGKVRIAPCGAFVSLPVTLIDVGAAYDPDISGYHLYWDQSAARYTNARPVDTATGNGTVLTVIYVGSTSFLAVVTPKTERLAGTVYVQNADGTSRAFEPDGPTAADRGTVLTTALGTLVKGAQAGQRGSTLVLDAGVTYAIDDVTVNDIDGCVIEGNNAVLIDADGTYDWILKITNSDDLVIRNLEITSSTAALGDIEATTNSGDGKGLMLQTCDRARLQNLSITWQCGLDGADGEFPNNVNAHGLFLQVGDDIVCENITVSNNGRYGIECRELVRPVFRNLVGNNNGRQIINVINESANPEKLIIEGVTGIGDQVFANPLLSGCPGISVGSGQFWVNSSASIRNVNVTWDNIDHDTSSQGNSYAPVKVTDYEHVDIDNMTIRQKSANAGTMEIFAFVIFDCEQLHINGMKTDSDIRNYSGRIETFTLTNSVINRQIRSSACLVGFECDRAIICNNEFFFNQYALDLGTEAGNYREVCGNEFRGAASNDYVFNASDDIELARGNLKIEGNNLDNCTLSPIAKLYELELGGIVTFGDGDDTPSVTRGVLEYETANTGSTTIQDFDDGYDGQEIRITIVDALTNVQDNAAIQLSGSTDFTPGSGGGKITLRRRNGVWQEVSRVQY